MTTVSPEHRRITWPTIAGSLGYLLALICLGLLLHYVWNDKSGANFLHSLAMGTMGSLIAAGLVMALITYKDSASISRIHELVDRLAPLGDRFAITEIEAIARNKDVPTELWIGLIHNLASDPEPVYFLGTSLRRWRTQHEYAQPLKVRLESRMRRARQERTEGKSGYETHFCLTNENALTEWHDFIRNVMTGISLVKNPNLMDYGISLTKAPTSIPYSAVYCARKLAVTPYTAKRDVGQSLSVFFRSDSNLYYLYKEDIEHCAKKAAGA